MRVIIHELPYKSRSDWFEIIPIGDIHLGNALCDEAALRRTVKHIKETDRCYWGGMGDMIDGINRADKRFQESQIAEWLWGYDDVVGPQIEVLTQILNPIKDKCLWMLRGNHEDFVLQKFQRDVYYEICRKMGLSEKNPIMLGYRGFIVMRMQRQRSGTGGASTYTYTIFAHHGYGGGRLEGGKALKLGRLPKHYQADLLLYGHEHVKMIGQPIQQLRPTATGGIVGKMIYTCMTGTYLQGYDADGVKEVYSEVQNLPPSALGSITVKVNPDRQEVQVTM